MRESRWRRAFRFAAIVVLLAPPLVLGSSRASAQSGEHRWAGLVFDSFARESGSGVEAWTVEDGGRIRHRDPATGLWSFQTTPPEVKDTLQRVHFLADGVTGWAVGQNGWVIKTVNGGGTWTVLARIDDTIPNDGVWEDLFDVHFVDASKGWLIGRHSFSFSVDGGATWNPVSLFDPGTGQFFTLDAGNTEAYTLDIVDRADGSRLGLAGIQPGIVLRSFTTDPSTLDLWTWEVVWDITDYCNAPYPPCGSIGNPLQGCECNVCTPMHRTWFEPWDVEISRHATQHLALIAGGVGAQCGMVFASTDDGLTWTKEWHECQCTWPEMCLACDADPAYNDDPQDPFDLNRHKQFKTLYGLAILDGDNSAVAVGYNGQHVVRDPTNGVWEDRSVFSAWIPNTQGSVIFPMVGAEALTQSGGAKFAIASGEGGHLRESTNGGNTYVEKVPAGPHRIGDVYFVDDDHGWQVGQYFRIAKSNDGGFNWTPQNPDADKGMPDCNAITFAPGGQAGVAVGGPHTPGGNTTTEPKIRYTTDGGSAVGWLENVTIVGDATFMDKKGLREVEWAGGSEFWAVGKGGLILTSSDGGQNWSQYLPPSDPYFDTFELEGVAFLNSSLGLFAGSRPNPPPNGRVLGAIYQYDSGGTPQWVSIALPPGVEIRALTDVDVDMASGVAWAVGDKLVNGLREGIVLTSSYSGGSFGAFSEVLNPPNGFPLPTAGEDLAGPVLSEVEIAPNTGDVWVGGLAGRVWVRSSAGAWTEVKSQTDAHVVGMSFVPVGQGAAGYIAGMRQSNTQQCVVRVQ